MDFETADRLNGAIRTIAIRHRALTASRLAPLGLHPGQEAVLLCLDQHGEQNQAQLAIRIDCEAPSVTTMVKKLEARGLVERRLSAADARTRLVRATPAGRDLTKQLKEVWVEIADETAGKLDDLNLDEIMPAVAALARALSGRGNLT